MDKKVLLTVMPLAAAVSGVCAADDRPNIVVIFVDDWGYNDAGYRNPVFITPNIDRLAASAIDFTRGYVPSPTSSPSRAGLLTGRHPLKTGFTRHINNRETNIDDTGAFGISDDDPGRMPNRKYLPLDEVTYAEILRDAGYSTVFIGKWHLGEEPYYPDRQGFDRTFGVSPLGQPVNYYPPYFVKGEADPGGRYLTDRLTDEAVKVITGHDYTRKPLLLHFSHYAVHSPHIGKKELIDKYLAQGHEPRFAQYLAMVESMDESVGRVLSAIAEAGVTENTVVFLLSDQGGYFSNAPLRGGKLDASALYEGGARVPFYVYDPSGLMERSIDDPVSTLDVFPTLADYAGIDPGTFPETDGISLRGAIRNGKRIAARPLFFYRSYDDLYASVLYGDLKYIATRSGNDRMYDLAKDPGEQTDVIGERSYRAQSRKLRSMLSGFLKGYEMSPVEGR